MSNGLPDPEARAAMFAYDPSAPLEATVEEVAAGERLRVERFEITSRGGERVPGFLLRDPTRRGPRPLVLIAHPATLDKASDYVLTPAREWVAQGAVCIAIDQAEHGERAHGLLDIGALFNDPKRRLDAMVRTTVDWMRVLDYAATRPDIDMRRVAFVGFSMGGMWGAPFVGIDKRVKAAVFCISGAIPPPADAPPNPDDPATILANPATYGPDMADRPTLLLAGVRDDVVTPAAAAAFFHAIAKPRQITWLQCGHWDFWPDGLKPIWPFLSEHL